MENDDKFKSDDPSDISMEDFEKTMRESFIEKKFQPGDKVTGQIVSITENYIFLDIGAKSEGIINSDELVDESGELTVSVGDTVDGTIMSTQDEILISYKMRKKDQTREILQDAYENRVPVQGRVADVNKGGFVIDLGKQRAFCPISQIDLSYVNNLQEYVGKNFHFYITRFDSSGRDIVVSRSALLKQESEQKAKETLKTLKPGTIIEGTVKRIIDIGAFVDIGGIDGLIHISELSWDRVENPSDIVALGQVLTVKVLNIDEENKRISLSLRTVQGNPWDTHIGTGIIEGNVYEGKITRLENYGAFVSLLPGIQGLLHISEMSWGKPIKHPQELFKPGDKVLVKVLSIDHENKRVSLGMKQLSQDPWDEAADVLQTGNILNAEINRIRPSGLEVLVHKDLIGFVPASLTGIPRNENFTKVFQIGQEISVQILEVDKQTRRLILSIVNPEKTDENVDYQEYLVNLKKGETQEEETQMGSFGRILSRAMEKKQQKDKDT